MTAPSTRTPATGSLNHGLAVWHELLGGGRPDPHVDGDRTSAALVGRWYQHFAVAIDGAVERAASGEERLPELVDAWLDVARRTQPVRAYVARHAGPLTCAEQRRQARLLARLLAENLRLLGADAPERRAFELVRELEVVAGAEDRAGRRLPASRAALLRGLGLLAPAPSSSCLGRRLSAWLHLSPTG
jgi:hypothetical protein